MPDIPPTEVKGGCIEIYENIWSKPYETIAALEKECKNNFESGISWQRAKTVGQGSYQTHRTNLDLNLSMLAETTNNNVLQEIHNTFFKHILGLTYSYNERYHIYENFLHEHYYCLKYSGGQEYKEHSDSKTETGRTLSVLCYLNDDYEGGEIEFVNFNFKLKPKAGSIVLFPSTFPYSHIAHPVKSGTKYALVTWIRGTGTI